MGLSVIVNPWQERGPGQLGAIAPWENWSWLLPGRKHRMSITNIGVWCWLGKNGYFEDHTKCYFEDHTKCCVSKILSCLMLVLQKVVRFVLNCLSHGKLCLLFVAEERISVKTLVTEPVNGCCETPGYNCHIILFYCCKWRTCWRILQLFRTDFLTGTRVTRL